MFIANLIGAAAAAAALASAPTPHAQVQAVQLDKGASYARLVTPLSSPADPVFDGRIWHCQGDTCQAAAQAGARPQSVARECESAAQKIGAFASYQTGAQLLGDEALAKCNTHARAR